MAEIPKMDRRYYDAYVCAGHHWWNERIGVGFSALGWLLRRGDTVRLIARPATGEDAP